MADVQAVLRKVAPTASAAFIAASKNAGAIMDRNGIKTATAQAHLIAHMGVESAGFRLFAENLNYSAARLTQVWPSRFPSLAAAQPYAKSPKALANKVYNGRMGNRAGSDDGWNYRGSGSLQHTGRSEFDRVKRRTGIDVVSAPDQLRDVKRADVMWQAACSYFLDRGVLPAAEQDNIVRTTQLINGGQNGLADRKIYLARAKAALAGKAIEVLIDTTTVEKAEDEKTKAKRATTAAPVGGGAAGGGSKMSGAYDMTAVIIGLSVAIIIGVLAVSFWRRYRDKQAVVEALQLATIATRVEAEEQPA